MSKKFKMLMDKNFNEEDLLKDSINPYWLMEDKRRSAVIVTIEVGKKISAKSKKLKKFM